MPEADLPASEGLSNADRYDNLAAFIGRITNYNVPFENTRNALARAHVLDKDGNIRNPRLIASYTGVRSIGRQGWTHAAEGGSP